jgi:murein DD-endopeptidase MepM/ murein hydrolase activator NlpD
MRGTISRTARRARWLLVAAALAAGAGGGALAAERVELQLPVACALKQTCFIQNYVDRDASPQAKDFMCGSRTYDAHNGTDIRLPTLAAQRAGVDVLAAADGEVLRRRDGVADVSVRSGGMDAVRGAECGNGVIVAHGDGWETQYCHLARGSVAVRPGEKVRAGQPVGRIGLSGQTEYPHLHFTVRHSGQIVDPFAFGAAPGSCGGGSSLWAPALRDLLAYETSAVLNAGFASRAVTMEAIESGEAGGEALGPDSPALVAFVRTIGLQPGDEQTLKLRAPDGAILAESTAAPADRAKAQWMMFSGRRRPAAGWARGRYEAEYTLTRGGAPALTRRFDVTL